MMKFHVFAAALFLVVTVTLSSPHKPYYDYDTPASHEDIKDLINAICGPLAGDDYRVSRSMEDSSYRAILSGLSQRFKHRRLNRKSIALIKTLIPYCQNRHQHHHTTRRPYHHHSSTTITTSTTTTTTTPAPSNATTTTTTPSPDTTTTTTAAPITTTTTTAAPITTTTTTTQPPVVAPPTNTTTPTNSTAPPQNSRIELFQLPQFWPSRRGQLPSAQTLYIRDEATNEFYPINGFY